MPNSPIQLFDLADASQKIFFSPFCWRTRMALKHKGQAFESLPWHFTESDRLAPDGAKKVPEIIDQDRRIGESSDIALYLDEKYPDRPALMADSAARARTAFLESWCASAVFPALRPIAVPHVFKLIPEKDHAYFRESREKALGMPLEELSKDTAAEKMALNNALAPANAALAHAPYFAGDAPDYSDYILFGTLMWPYAVCPENPVDMASPVGQWFDRLLDHHGGFARNTPTVRAV